MEWGWIDTVAALERRLDLVEAKIFDRSRNLPEVHEIETVPGLSQNQSGTDMIQTHVSDTEAVYAVPFRFTGEMSLRRISLICAATATNTSNVGLCLYQVNDIGRVSTESPRTAFTPVLRKIETGAWVATSGTTHVRLSVEYPGGVFLSTFGRLYYACWTCDDDEGTVFCPNSTTQAADEPLRKTFLAAYTTNGTASPSAGFPDTLSLTGNTATQAAPCVMGRSLTGIRVYGSFVDDV